MSSLPKQFAPILSLPKPSAAILSPPKQFAPILSLPKQSAAILSPPIQSTPILFPPIQSAAILSLPKQFAPILSLPKQSAAISSPPKQFIESGPPRPPQTKRCLEAPDSDVVPPAKKPKASVTLTGRAIQQPPALRTVVSAYAMSLACVHDFNQLAWPCHLQFLIACSMQKIMVVGKAWGQG